MTSGYYQFEQFSLHPEDRQLRWQSQPVEINARYFDALALLVQQQGKLVSRERFFAEVWDGIAVTDEALTQCIKTLRKQLGDDAARPRFIETVPKHGYRFIAAVSWQAETVAPVESARTGLGHAESVHTESVHTKPVHAEMGSVGEASTEPPSAESARAAPPRTEPQRTEPQRAQSTLAAQTTHVISSQAGAGAAGGAVAGVLGALLLAAGGLVQSQTAEVGGVSALLVVICLCTAIGVSGAAGVSFALAAAHRVSGTSMVSSVLGGALGGMLTGAAGQLIGSDAFNLLLGRTPGDITGAAEGFVVGASIGGGFWLAQRYARTPARTLITGAACGAVAGLLIIWSGGELMTGSLSALAQAFPDSRLQLDNLGALLGEGDFGPWARTLTGMIEGGLFGACVVLGLWWQLMSRSHFHAQSQRDFR